MTTCSPQRPRAARLLSAALLLLVLPAACGDDDAVPDGGPPDAPSTTRDAAGADAARPADATPSASVAVLLGLSANEERTIREVRLHADGTVTDPGLEVACDPGARALVFSEDGREALAVAGMGPDAPKLLQALELAPDGSSLAVAQALVLEGQNSPTSILRTGADEAVVSMRGPDPDHLLTLQRGAGGWAVGPSAPSGEGPVQLHAIGEDGHALLVQADLLEAQIYAIVPIARQIDGSWARENDGYTLAESVFDVAVHPGGAIAYVPLTDSGGSTVLNPPGSVLTLGTSGETRVWAQVGEPATVDRGASTIALSRDGLWAVQAAPYAAFDAFGRVVFDHYELQTIEVSTEGTPTAVAGTRTRLTSEMIDAYDFAPTGHLVLAGQSPTGTGGLRSELIVLSRSGSEWSVVGAAFELPGTVTAMAIGPALVDP